VKFYKYILLILISSFFSIAYSQEITKEVIPSISEIIIPSSTETKDNFNLMYEVHLARNKIPTPSFWYKIIFNDSCDFEFTLFPLNEEDRYEFFMYKIEGNEPFCEAFSNKKVRTLNHFKYTKKYTDTDQSEKFRANLINVKPIPVLAGDAIYLSVIAVKGKDCGHILDCRTSVSSMVIKVINDSCSEVPPLKENMNSEVLALQYLSDELCLNKKKSIQITSIDLKGNKRKTNNNLDFNSYTNQQAVQYKKYQNKTVIETISSAKKEVLKHEVLPIDPIKTTALLNLATSIQENQTSYQTINNAPNLSRFKVDRVMFSLVLNALTEQKSITKQEVKDKQHQLKRIRNRTKRKEPLKELRALKKKRKAVEREIVNVKMKLKKINTLIARSHLKNNEDFVFEGNINKANTSLTNTEGLIYKVQIGVYKNKISKEIFKGLSPVFEDPFDGGVKYSVGAFKKLLYAKQAKQYVVDLGLKDAFIVAYFNDKRISMRKAIELE
jgi:hypothetical protein